MKTLTLQEIIRHHIQLRETTNGWYQVLCKVCNDHGRKGLRAGFRFDGDTVGYNCFNCGHTASFNPEENRTMPQKMVTVLDAFSVPKDDWQQVLFTALQQEGKHTERKQQFTSIEPTEVELPPFFSRIDPNGDEFDQYAIEYLRDERTIDWQDYPFYIGRKTSHPGSLKWHARLIVPIFKDGKLVYYFGRDLTGLRSRKYLNPDIQRENVLYGYERLLTDTDEPIYIVEGWFDAWHLQGVAVFSNKMTPNQIRWIQRSKRPKVVIPDKYGDGHLLAEKALELGWSISTPDIGDCKDVDEAVKRYGKLYTLMTVKEQTCLGFEAETKLKLYCVKSANKKNDT